MRRTIVSRLAGGSALAGLALALALGMTSAPALAQGAQTAAEVIAPQNWGVNLQPAAGPVKEAIHDFNQLVLWIIVAITAFVGVLLAYVMWRFRAAANAVPSRTSHNTVLEVAWTVVPVLILIVIAIPSFRLIYYEDRAVDPEMTINVTGRQWYWHYAYPDAGNLAFDSYPIADADLKPGQLRNLDVDNPLVIPVGKNIRVLTTGQDVIHSFFVPSLGVQKYTIPGRTLETWFRADRPGTFYGQCNQICGQNHWFMPIVVKAVPQAEYETWLADAKTRFMAENGVAPAPAKVASEATATAPGTAQVAELHR
ncbi:cytochrome c oxidase subunit II [Pseudoroseomonas wenyumeiae]|uniref:Cytochrome c oxidase subunit 2 n=1 Tax=Teichococcus wenyumeiae TaxID=2478470 RepID=A0A3A9JEZ2_9PROT|nr:cytochrome c oxidase subunit II [Pseudoroseomonas wenyumeiae]RKK02084.1 cytochrome c oxidase subunit II [Pseudoroseomonas wenyumeiae]RMI26680.1 cytochrome c oxidase subunit II [Pseudoroseomonas wenyumeiae]